MCVYIRSWLTLIILLTAHFSSISYPYFNLCGISEPHTAHTACTREHRSEQDCTHCACTREHKSEQDCTHCACAREHRSEQDCTHCACAREHRSEQDCTHCACTHEHRSEKTRLGKELSGALVATLSGMLLANIGILPPGPKVGFLGLMSADFRLESSWSSL
jgi:hypothetical protein